MTIRVISSSIFICLTSIVWAQSYLKSSVAFETEKREENYKAKVKSLEDSISNLKVSISLLNFQITESRKFNLRLEELLVAATDGFEPCQNILETIDSLNSINKKGIAGLDFLGISDEELKRAYAEDLLRFLTDSSGDSSSDQLKEQLREILNELNGQGN